MDFIKIRKIIGLLTGFVASYNAYLLFNDDNIGPLNYMEFLGPTGNGLLTLFVGIIAILLFVETINIDNYIRLGSAYIVLGLISSYLAVTTPGFVVFLHFFNKDN